MIEDKNNPLLQQSHLPRFDLITSAHVEPALDHLLDRNRTGIQHLEQISESATWDNFVQVLEDMEDDLSKMWSPVSHLNSVKDSDELRQVYENSLSKLSSYHTELGQNEKLFLGFQHIQQSENFGALSNAQKKVISNALRDFHLAGVDLSESDKSRFKSIQNQLAQLTNQFERNLLDATQAWYLCIDQEEQITGLPQTVLDMAREAAKEKQLNGWLFGLSIPSYLPFMTYCDNRELREKMYQAYVTRASDQGPDAGKFDNSELICEILSLRQESAKLLDFNNFAALSLETKMAKSEEQIIDFLLELANKARPSALKELETLHEFARTECGLDDLQAWDLAYVSEKLRQSLFNFSDEDVRPYFPANKVFEGMFEVVERLYGVQVKRKDGVAVWNPDVEFYELIDQSGSLRGQFYLDPYVRAGKRSGAWMDVCISRKCVADYVQIPVAYLVCNFSPPLSDRPALLTHEEVVTVFHEFGHGLHHMLTQVDHVSVSGINGVAWDAVELPSQFMENWCWETEALNLISGHYKTGEALPADLLHKMRSARNFQSAMQTLRQVEFALFDMRLHGTYKGQNIGFVMDLIDRIRDEVAIMKPPVYNRFPHSFSHIFAGGYAAGYYSYKWAEVLSADAFSRFEEEGIFNRSTGLSFLHNILEKGSVEEPDELFFKFRGREPEIDALLRHSGLSG